MTNPRGPYPDNNPKSAFGIKKPSLALIPSTALLEESVAFMDGAEKYGAYNWREKTVSVMVYLNAAMRHLAQHLNGERLDPESKNGATNLAAARACIAIIIDADATGNLIDDRPKPAPVGDLIRAFAAARVERTPAPAQVPAEPVKATYVYGQRCPTCPAFGRTHSANNLYQDASIAAGSCSSCRGDLLAL